MKLFVGSQLPKSEQNFNNHQSVKYDAHLFRIKISQLWGLRSDIAENVTPSERNQIRPFHPIPSLSNASWLRYLCMYSTLRISLHLQHSQAKQNNAHLCRQSLTMSSACIFPIHIVERFVWDVHGWGQQLNTGTVKRIGVVYGLCVWSTLTPWIHHRQQWGQRRCPAFQSSYSPHSCCCSRITCSSIWKRWSPSLRSKPISSWNTRSKWVYRFSTYVIFW